MIIKIKPLKKLEGGIVLAEYCVLSDRYPVFTDIYIKGMVPIDNERDILRSIRVTSSDPIKTKWMPEKKRPFFDRFQDLPADVLGHVEGMIFV